MRDRIAVNIGVATLVAEPVPGRPNELALSVMDADERPIGRKKLGVDSEMAIDIIDAAKGFVAHTVEQAMDWLTEKAAAAHDGRSRLAA